MTDPFKLPLFALLELDSEGIILRASPAYLDRHATPGEVLEGQQLAARLPPEERHILADAIATARDSAGASSCTLRLGMTETIGTVCRLARVGETIWLTAEGTSTERAVEHQERIFEHLADGVVAVNETGIIELANGELLRQLALPEGTVLEGMPMTRILPPMLLELIATARQTHAVVRGDLSLPEERIGVASASPVGDHDDVVVLVRDVTVEREIDRMKTDFIATVSHELRTPLTSVLGFAKIIGNKLDKNLAQHIPEDDVRAQRALKQVRQNLDIVFYEAERLTALINDVLDISKMESGHMEWKRERLHSDELVVMGFEASVGLFPEDGSVELLLDLEPNLPDVIGDPYRLQQVFINLISNAAKFTEKGSVTVTARSFPDGVEFAVQDTGPGIDLAAQTAVFEKFKQVGDTLTGKPKGTGLGLPICRQIVEAHGGDIWLESEVGQGTRFAFKIPAADAGEGAERPSAPESVRIIRAAQSQYPLPPNQQDILVVDDDPNLRELLRQQLTDHGYEVRLAKDGYEAMEQVRLKRPSLVLLDVMMPQISGFDVAAMLKGDPKTEAIPIIILSIVQDTDRGLKLGVDRYLTKPAAPDDLVHNIETLLQRTESPRRVLVVDAESPTSSDVVRLLESKGYNVVGVCTGEECVDAARRESPDMIIVESLVEGHHELVRAIRLERELEHVLVVQLVDAMNGTIKKTSNEEATEERP